MWIPCNTPCFPLQCGDNSVIQKACSCIKQDQRVNQKNTSLQLGIAFATEGGSASVSQTSSQSNSNSQLADNDAININECEGCVVQCAQSCIEQEQNVDQENFSRQRGFAIASGSGYSGDGDPEINANGSPSSSEVTQDNSQDNSNEQIAESESTNICGNAPPPDSLNKKTSIKTTQDKEQRKVNGLEENVDLPSIPEMNWPEGLNQESGLNLVVSINQGGEAFEIKADDKGKILLNEGQLASKELSGKGNSIKISINQDGESLEINADEQGNLYVNGEKVENSKE